MKRILCLPPVLLLLFCSCKKQATAVVDNTVISDTSPTAFTLYSIKKGQQYCDQSTFFPVEYAELKFVVKFDSSAIYNSIDANNQYDINKLYGFSDNDSLHQVYSARFGWRWSDKALRIFAYVYNKGVRNSKELGTVAIGAENDCSIKVTGGHYIFSLNNHSDTLLRSATTHKGRGYRLYPYFGGDELAPHDITILIKEIKVD